MSQIENLPISDVTDTANFIVGSEHCQFFDESTYYILTTTILKPPYMIPKLF